MDRLLSRPFIAGLSLCLLAMFTQFAPAAKSQAATQGQWQTLPYTMPINPVHVALMNNGKVVIVTGSGNNPANTTLYAGVWDPQAGTISTQIISWDMFCNGMVVLPDGRPFIMGGTIQYDPFYGQPKTAVFDPSTNKFTDLQNMNDGRWYPTSTVLGDGRVLVFSGLKATGGTNTSVQLYTVGSGWSAAAAAPYTPPLYPRLHLLPDGTVFNSGSATSSSIFNPSTMTWKTGVANTVYGGVRTYGSSVMLPLTPANNYKPRIMTFGGVIPQPSPPKLSTFRPPNLPGSAVLICLSPELK